MKNLLLLLLSHGAIFSMELPSLPQRGQKRVWRQSLLAPQGNLPVTKLQLVGRSAFELLPKDLKMEILKILTTARGSTNRARLDNATENIRSFFRINTQFAPLGNDPQIIEYLITELANRYANGDKVAAAIALGTEAAGRWLKSKLAPFKSLESKWTPDTAAIRYDRKVDEQLIDAASNGRINVLKFLREFVPFYADLSWNVALSIAVKRDQVEVVKFILAESLIQDKLDHLINDTEDEISNLALLAIQNNQEQMLDILLKAGADIDTRDTEYVSPLDLALGKQNSSLVRRVLKEIPELVNEPVESVGTSIITPLIFAITIDNVEIVKTILEAGADVNFRPAKGTALEQAQELSFKKNSPEIIRLLKEYGAK